MDSLDQTGGRNDQGKGFRFAGSDVLAQFIFGFFAQLEHFCAIPFQYANHGGKSGITFEPFGKLQ